SSCSFTVTVVDTEPPTTGFVVTPPNPDNDATPYFEWAGMDNNGCTAPPQLLYSTKLDDGDWSDWSAETSKTLGPLPEGVHTFQVRAKDEAGNVETTASYTWLIDLTPPAITILVPEDGASYALNEEMLAEWWVVDELSGLHSAEGTVASGESIDTASVGLHEFTVTAADNAGNTSVATVTYRVAYNVLPGGIAGGGGALGEGVGGFLDKSIAGGGAAVGIAPLEAVYTVGEVIHASFAITDVAGNPVVGATTTCTLVRVSIAEDGEESYLVLGFWMFGFDEDTGLYFLDIETEGLEPGIYDLWLGFGDGVPRRLRISLEEPPE
ncbi:hypothetical protein LR090_02995, partial [Candidatus Bipolaricaulota bacterium]|nr:hypothetical protein [Candidatus Bipolaricaulota bacterium]